MINDIKEKDLKKMWFCISCKYQIEVMLGMLVRWDVEQKPYSAYIYETKQFFTGSIPELLKSVNETLNKLFIDCFNEEVLNEYNPSFFTQAFQGENSTLASGFLFLPSSETIKDALSKGYTLNHWHNNILSNNLSITKKNEQPIWLKGLNIKQSIN